jgi:amino acid transporter
MQDKTHWLMSIAIGVLTGVVIMALNLLFNGGGILQFEAITSSDVTVAVFGMVIYLFTARILLLKPELVHDRTQSRKLSIWGSIGAGFMIFVCMSSPILFNYLYSPWVLALILFALMSGMWALGMKYEEIRRDVVH